MRAWILPLFRRRTAAVDWLLPELYLHGLAAGDFDRALLGLLGEDAPVSEASVARPKAVWQAEYAAWKWRSLAALEVVYLWVDEIYVKAVLEKEKAALLVVLGALRDGSKVMSAVEAGPRESTASWSAVLRDLQQHGLNSPKLIVGDGYLGIWGALANVYPAAQEQRCGNHRLVNLLDRVQKKHQPEAKALLRGLMYADTKAVTTERKRGFQSWYQQRGCAAAGELLQDDWKRLVTYYRFPLEHWKHLRTTDLGGVPVCGRPLAHERGEEDEPTALRSCRGSTSSVPSDSQPAELRPLRLRCLSALRSRFRGSMSRKGAFTVIPGRDCFPRPPPGPHPQCYGTRTARSFRTEEMLHSRLEATLHHLLAHLQG